MRVGNIILLASLIVSSLAAFGQHVELGGFASYNNFDIPPFPGNAVGVGGRLDVGLNHYIVLEGEGSYDFKHPTVQIVSTTVGVTVNTQRIGAVHANGGLKLQTKGGSYFLFLKGGIIQFMPDTRSRPVIGNIIGVQTQTGTDFTEAVFYPGVGIGFHAGPLGIRADVGDEMYWDVGTHHNLRVTFGPTIRF